MIQRARLSSSYWGASLKLDDAYGLCAAVTCEHSKSFYLSTALLPREQRRAIRAFYAFCRAADDIADAPLPGTGAASRLADWRTRSRLPGPAQDNPILSAWADTRDRYGVPQQYIEELIDGCEMDLHVRRYETFAALQDYCYRVASTVGLVSMQIIGTVSADPARRARAAASAIRLGIALQLTNIMRDVGEDLALGRIYLPQEDLRRFGYGESDLRHGVVDDRFRALMRFEIARAQAIYERDYHAIAWLRPEGRLAVGAAISLYRNILDCIAANDYDVFRRRAHLSLTAKLCRLPAIYRRVRALCA